MNSAGAGHRPAPSSAINLANSLGALCLILLAAIVTAESFNSNSNAQQQEIAAAGAASPPAGGALEAAARAGQSDLTAAASGNNYLPQQAGDGHQQHAAHQAAGGQKSKKIQIVYIKVPLAKLRPSLAGQYGADQANSSQAKGEQYDATDFKSKQQLGSQLASDEQPLQQQMNLNDIANDDATGETAPGGAQRQLRNQPQSFLIPMALVQTGLGEQQQQTPATSASEQGQFSFELPKLSMGQGSAEGFGASQLHPQHAQPLTPNNDQAGPLSMQQMGAEAVFNFNGNSARTRSVSPMQWHQLSRQQQQQAQSGGVSIPHGFMSSFLFGEKEKMTAAAMRLRQQQQRDPAGAQTGANSGASLEPTHQQQVASASQASRQVSAQSNNDLHNRPSQPSPASSAPAPQSTAPIDPKGPGGLMPSMMAPLSRMPDNAIGQAYGAAVGIALPAESGSPSSLLSSPSTQTNYGKPLRAAATSSNSNNATSSNTNNYGTNNGTPGEGAYSSGTGSSTSFGANGPSQQGASSSGKSYPSLSPGFAASAHSSGFGSGISTSGASGAFSDYPGAHSGASSNHYSHQQAAVPQSQQQSQNSLDYNGQQRLKQAKKTIIPIVVQVEHAILENAAANAAVANAYQQQQQAPAFRANGAGNKYGRANRQLGDHNGGGKRARFHNAGHQNNNNNKQQLYGAATNEIAQYGDIPPGAQWINAANAYDISQITAQINAENAASAAAALAQADAAFGPGVPAAYSPPGQSNQAAARYPVHRPPNGGGNAAAAYAAGLQSAASALFANTHPVIQAAASGGFASVSKLGAKLGEMMALPSMQVPSSVAAIGSSLPSAFSSLTNQMGAQLGQAVQQVAKEHPHASAFARQVAQQAGIQLPNFNGNQLGMQASGPTSSASGVGMQVASGPSMGPQQHAHHQHGHGPQNGNQQQQAAASNHHVSQLSPQAQLQNLKLSIGQNLQSAAATLIGVNQKANALSGNQLLNNANQMAFSAALKQLSAISPTAAQLANQLAGGVVQAAASTQQQTVMAPPSGSAGSDMASANGVFTPSNQQQANALNQFFQQQQQVFNQLANIQQASAPSVAGSQPQALGSASSGGDSPSAPSAAVSASSALESSAAAGPSKPAKTASSFKSKFLAFFQPPKFISNLLSWNDRADERNDQAEMYIDAGAFADKLEAQTSAATMGKNSTSPPAQATPTNNATTSSQAASAATISAAAASVAAKSTGTTTSAASSTAPPPTIASSVLPSLSSVSAPQLAQQKPSASATSKPNEQHPAASATRVQEVPKATNATTATATTTANAISTTTASASATNKKKEQN